MIYLFTGDHFQVERAYRTLRAKLLNPTLQDFNLDLLEGKGLPASRVLQACQTLPVLAASRLVIVQGADQISKGELEKLEPHLAKIAKQAELILLAEKPDRRMKFWQQVAEVGQWQEFKPLYPRELPRWIQQEVRAKGKTIQPEAVDWLVERLGSELGLITSSLEKATLLTVEKKEITLQDLEAVVSSFPWKSLFALTDAIGSKNLPQALTLFRQISLSGESPVGLLALIARHFRILFKVKETGTGAPPYFLKNYQQQAAGFSVKSLKSGIGRIFKTDWELKSSPLSSELLMERLFWELCYSA